MWTGIEEDMEMYLAVLNVTCLGDILMEVTQQVWDLQGEGSAEG